MNTTNKINHFGCHTQAARLQKMYTRLYAIEKCIEEQCCLRYG